MKRSLAGRTVLVVEDEPLVALDVVEALQAAGAWVLTARNLRDALISVEDRTLTAAVIDHGLNDGDSSRICARLTERGIRFVIYSGHTQIEGPCSWGELMNKPVNPKAIVATLVDLLTSPDSGREVGQP